MIQINVRIPTELKTALAVYCEEHDTDIAKVVRRGIKRVING